MTRNSLFAALFLLAACGQQGSPEIKLTDAWARPTVGQTPAAVYVTIDNQGGSPDRLVEAFTDRAAMAMVHQNEVVNGVARMRMAGEINIPARDQIKMAPGGTHIMLQGLRAPLRTGDRFDLVLKFRVSGDKRVEVKVVKPEGE
jgi:copper(I)-binding protein